MPETAAAVQRLRSAATVRERCTNVLQAVQDGRSAHFRLDLPRLDEVARRVAAITRERHPQGRIPPHGRWRQFAAGGVDRAAQLEARLAGHSAAARARARIDLTLLSVLLDADAGARWRYRERESGLTFERSEGLAVAGMRAFMAGCFSSDAGDPCRVDAAALGRLDAAALAQAFQAEAGNPLPGLEARAALLRRLGEALRAQPQTFSALGQPGHLFDALTHHPHAPRLQHHHPVPVAQHHHPVPVTQHHRLDAARLLQALLDAFSGLWPDAPSLRGAPLGDCWPHALAGGEGASAGWVPLHRLGQWLAGSLVEPLQRSGVTVEGLAALTGLADQRNGGLLLDAGVIVPRDAGFAARPHRPGDEAVVEWRALTVALLDALLPRVREQLGDPGLSLAGMQAGGSRAAGRRIAAERRPGGAPPLTLESDGTPC